MLSSETGLTSGTLTLLVPNTFSRLAVIANSASATSTSVGTLTLNFTDGSAFVTNYNAQDWFNNPGFALESVDRINLTSGATDGESTGNPRFYQTTINLAAALGASNKPLASLTFGKASAANATAIYALSALPASAFTLATVTNLPAINIQAKAATLEGQITVTGGEAAAITLFYGTTDGGTNAALWAQNVPLGLQGGSYSQGVTGLTPDVTYYFTSMAVNSVGTNWARPSAAFQTLPLVAPMIANQPASNVQGTLATLNGQILSTGGETPPVTLFYGTTGWRNECRRLGTEYLCNWTANRRVCRRSPDYPRTRPITSPPTQSIPALALAWAAPSQTFTTRTTNTPSLASVVPSRC